MVVARVPWMWASGTSSSPGRGRRASSVVAPSRRSLGVAKTKAAAVPMLAIASRRINRWLMALPKPSCRPTRVLLLEPGLDGGDVALHLWSHPAAQQRRRHPQKPVELDLHPQHQVGTVTCWQHPAPPAKPHDPGPADHLPHARGFEAHALADHRGCRGEDHPVASAEADGGVGELLDVLHLAAPLGFVGVVAAVVEDLLRRPLDVRFSLDYRQAAALGGDHRRVQGRPLLPRYGARGSGLPPCRELRGASFHIEQGLDGLWVVIWAHDHPGRHAPARSAVVAHRAAATPALPRAWW